MKLPSFLILTTLSFISWSLTSCSDDEPGDTGPEICPTDKTQYTESMVMVSVLDYNPAPGQFVNEIPEYEDGDDADIMAAKCTDMLNYGHMVTLGAWGGNITLKLNEPIVNITNDFDLKILGNSIGSSTTSAGYSTGSAEPGIIMVMQDINGNGLADDTWLEIKGSAHDKSIDEYSVTYFAPTSDSDDNKHIQWTDSQNKSGYIAKNAYHQQSYFPLWNNAESITMTGRRLPDNAVFNSDYNTYALMTFDFGYADNHKNTDKGAMIDLDWAVNALGENDAPSQIDFIKIYTGVFQTNGAIGECSTEIGGIVKLEKR